MQKKGFQNDFILNEKKFDYSFVYRPFREIDVKKNSKSWDRVTKLEHGKVYVEVSDSIKEELCLFFKSLSVC